MAASRDSGRCWGQGGRKLHGPDLQATADGWDQGPPSPRWALPPLASALDPRALSRSLCQGSWTGTRGSCRGWPHRKGQVGPGRTGEGGETLMTGSTGGPEGGAAQLRPRDLPAAQPDHGPSI